ncbi:MAG: hypothetical protein JWN40_5355 [Phycisphaerales bacterium]|nr:hypothetical protein [Phycisphaerales bacterium]
MSSISINGSNPGLAQFFQKLSSSAAAPTVAAPVAPIAAPSTAPTDAVSSDTSAARATGGHHHGHGGLFKKVESAVTTALDAAKSDPNADPNKVVQDAIAKVFKDSGVSPPAGAGGANARGNGAGKADADGDQDGSANPAGDVSAAHQAFTQTLQAFGVSASQFHADFLAAVQGAQGGGQADTSSLFKDFPPGSTLDTTA